MQDEEDVALHTPRTNALDKCSELWFDSLLLFKMSRDGSAMQNLNPTKQAPIPKS